MTQPLSGRRVLVVEDESLVAMLLETILEDMECIPVGPASNIDDGEALARDTADLDAALLDVNVAGRQVFPVAEVLQLMRFAELGDGDIKLTEPGRQFVGLEPDARKKLFAQHLLNYVPLAGHIRRVLDERGTHRAPASRFRDELEDHMSESFAQQTMRTVTSWGRFGEVFAYDEVSGIFSLDNPG